MPSERLGLDLVVVGDNLRLFDRVPGELLRTNEESQEDCRRAQKRAEEEFPSPCGTRGL